jgi:hypothetical protein
MDRAKTSIRTTFACIFVPLTRQDAEITVQILTRAESLARFFTEVVPSQVARYGALIHLLSALPPKLSWGVDR